MSLETVPLKDSKVFQKIRVGANELSTRIAFLPTTRFRALANHVPSNLQVKYYDQRSQHPGTLLVTEGTSISEDAALYNNVPGIWNDEQASAWKKVTDKIHANGSYASIQLWAIGRQGVPALLKEKGYDYVSASDVYVSEVEKKAAEAAGNPLRALTVEEIDEFVNVKYPNAARKALDAGFDYFEIHAAHGYLIDQFLQPSTNKRTDKYGGSIENRARFALEVVDKLIEVVGAHRLAIRISPWAQFQGMKGDKEEIHPIVTFGYLLSELQNRANAGNKLAYVSVVEPRFQGFKDVNLTSEEAHFEKLQASKNSNDFVYQIWDGVVVKGGNYSYDLPDFKSALHDLENDRTLVGFSRYFTSNPDLVNRLKYGYPLEPYARNEFYTPSNWHYSTFTNYAEQSTVDEEAEKKTFPQAIESIEEGVKSV